MIEKNRTNEKFITSLCFFCLGHQGGRRCRITLDRTCPVPYRTIKDAWPQTAGNNIQIGFQMQDHNVKQLGRISMYAKCIGGCMQGDSVGSNPRLCLGKK